MEVKGQLGGVISLFLQCGIWMLNSGWWQVPLPTKSSGKPSADIFLHTYPFMVKTSHRYQSCNFQMLNTFLASTVTVIDNRHLADYFWLVLQSTPTSQGNSWFVMGTKGVLGPQGSIGLSCNTGALPRLSDISFLTFIAGTSSPTLGLWRKWARAQPGSGTEQVYEVWYV